jgi:hypothetical protein
MGSRIERYPNDESRKSVNSNFEGGIDMKKVFAAFLAMGLTIGLSVPAEAASTKTYKLSTFGWFKFPTTVTMPKKKNSCTNLNYEAKATNSDMYPSGFVTLSLGKGANSIIDGQIWSPEGDLPYQKVSIRICNYKPKPSVGYGPFTKGNYTLMLFAITADNRTSNAIGWITVR